MYKSFALHPFIQRLRAHPGFSSADPALVAEAEAHPAYCLASRAVQRWEAMQRYRHASRAHAQQWNVYGSGIGLRQLRALLCRGAVCAVLVRRLMRFQGQYVAMNALHHACCVISRRHFLVALAPGPVAPSGPGFLRIFGSKGSSNGQFNYPRSMAWDLQGNVVVADNDNHRLQVIRLSDGACLRIIGSKGSGAGQFNCPYGVAFDSAGHIIVADTGIIECRCCATATAATYEPSAAKAVETGSSTIPAALRLMAAGTCSCLTKATTVFKCCV
jgi:hypothetical protein